MNSIKCMIIRAGTSKGVYFLEEDLPKNRDDWEEFLLDVMGSPDERQIDGVGGANSLTSKVAIIKQSSTVDIDVEYTFAQVSIIDNVVDFRGNCGNISSGVGVFAIKSGLVKKSSPTTTVRILNTNTNKIIENTVQIVDNEIAIEGNCKIAGVPNAFAKIDVTFLNPEGAVTGRLLPTGMVKDLVDTSVGKLDISIVDSANPVVFVKAEDIGLNGTELHYQFSKEKLNLIEEIRSIGCQMCNIEKKENATTLSPAVPKIAIVSYPKDYICSEGELCKAEDMDLLVRMMSMQKPHKALAITGGICISSASKIEGTIVQELTKNSSDSLVLGHPGGLMKVSNRTDNHNSKVTVERTARIIMIGVVFTKKHY